MLYRSSGRDVKQMERVKREVTERRSEDFIYGPQNRKGRRVEAGEVCLCRWVDGSAFKHR